MKNISRLSAFILLFVVCLAFQFFFYAEVSFRPNQFLFSSNGDGISSYYNSIYHIEHDSAYLSFEGMNYPFGEHLTYSVNNPLLTNAIKFTAKLFPQIADYTIGIINISILLSFLLTTIFIFLIFEEFKINRILAVFSSFGIMMLSPQVFRMLGHLSLAYSFAIPLFIWILIKSFKQKQKIRWDVFLFFFQVIWIFIHPYYTAIAASMLISFALMTFFIDSENRRNKLKYMLKLIILALLPILLYKLFLVFTDTHSCRTDNPYGFLVYTSELKSIFVPNHAPLRPFLDKFFKIEQEWEGMAYIGTGSVITLFVGLVYLIYQKFVHQIRIRDNQLVQNQLLIILLGSAVTILLFSMGLPFKLVPGYLPEKLSFLKEFRTLGRFAWVFYYVITIYCTYLIHQYILYLDKERKSKPAIFIILLFCGFFVIEGYAYHREISRSIVSSPNYFKQKDEPGIKNALRHVEISEYQAIMPLPYYHSGSENFTKSPTNKSLLYSELLSYKTTLPLVSSFLARTSIGESKLLMQLLAPPEFDKPVKNFFKNQKHFLVLYTKELLSENEKAILSRSEPVYDQKEFRLCRLPFDSLVKNSMIAEKVEREILFSESFDHMPSNLTYKGNGALTGKMKDYTTIYDFNPDSLPAGQEYFISFWMYNCGENCGQDRLNSLVYIHHETISGEIEWLSIVNPSNAETMDSCWSKVELFYKPKTPESKIKSLKLVIKGDSRLKKDFIIDELLCGKKLNQN